MNKYSVFAPVLSVFIGMGAVTSAVADERHDVGAVAAADSFHQQRDRVRGDADRRMRMHSGAMERESPMNDSRNGSADRGRTPAAGPSVKPGSATRDAELFYELYERT